MDEVGAPDPRAIRDALAADLRLLAQLHDREPDAALLEELGRAPIAELLALVLEGETARSGCALLERTLADLPRPITRAVLDELAAEYAAIYLVHAYRAAPSESPWLDKDKIERQEPMFEVRGWYRHYGLEVPDWRHRPDDHLVHELRFLAHLLELHDHPAALNDAARFMDAHPLLWVPNFGRRVARRCASPFFAGIALLTVGYLEELRALLVELAGVAPPAAVASRSEGQHSEAEEPARPYLPGAGPGW
jgi:TorA maturation chaperone TorD